MPIDKYGVLRGKPVKIMEGTEKSPHYQILIVDSQKKDYRIAVNVKSSSNNPDLLSYVDESFQHPGYIAKLMTLPEGITPLKSAPGGVALDFIRGGMFDVNGMQEVDEDIPETMDQILDRNIQKAMYQNDCEIFAVGQYWNNQPGLDQYFGFSPQQGIHDIHMNQGNYGHWKKDNGIWQDGGLFFHYPSENTWAAFFMAFKSQSFDTDNEGNPMDG